MLHYQRKKAPSSRYCLLIRLDNERSAMYSRRVILNIAVMGDSAAWYAALIKPSFAPPAWIFAPVWTVLYILIAVSFGYVFYLFIKKRLSFSALLPFLLNLIFNFAFSPIQFGLQNNFLAALDILLVLGTLIWALKAIYRVAPWVAYINIPYLLWVSFATLLQLSVTYLNT